MAEALGAAIRVFRERGYHATSVADLKQATALASGSIYKAFKDKRAVFLAAFDQYVSERDALRTSALKHCGTGKERLRELLRGYAESSSGVEGQRGCLVVGSAVELSTFDGELARRVKGVLGRNEALLADIIREGQADGSITPDVDVEAAARLMLCVLQGMRVVGKTGRTRDEMLAVVEVALRVIE
jgi:TetR/AcrR family transcriptional repressor of nem operon